VIVSRQKSDFEPSMSWQLQELRLWLQYTHPEGATKIGLLGPTEESLRAEFKDDEDTFMLRLHDAKYTAWKRCYMLFVNPQIPIPTRKQFETYVAKMVRSLSTKSADRPSV
jgi:hypothetical protein